MAVLRGEPASFVTMRVNIRAMTVKVLEQGDISGLGRCTESELIFGPRVTSLLMQGYHAGKIAFLHGRAQQRGADALQIEMLKVRLHLSLGAGSDRFEEIRQLRTRGVDPFGSKVINAGSMRRKLGQPLCDLATGGEVGPLLVKVYEHRE